MECRSKVESLKDWSRFLLVLVVLASEGQLPAWVWQKPAWNPASVRAVLKSPHHSYLTVLISCLALASNWLIMSFWMCELVWASRPRQWQSAASNLGVWPACLCGVNSVVTVDEAGGAPLPWAGPPSNGTFSSYVQSRGHSLNMLNKVWDTNICEGVINSKRLL